MKTVLYAGFSTTTIRPGKDLDRIALLGWTASVTTYQFFRRWGLTAEVASNASNGTNQRVYLFGGTVRGLQRKRVALTGRVLAGGTNWQPSSSLAGAYGRQSGFTFGFGQSIDFKLSESFAFRLQPDLRFVRFEDATGTSKLSLVQPFSVGLVYQFGKR